MSRRFFSSSPFFENCLEDKRECCRQCESVFVSFWQKNPWYLYSDIKNDCLSFNVFRVHDRISALGTWLMDQLTEGGLWSLRLLVFQEFSPLQHCYQWLVWKDDYKPIKFVFIRPCFLGKEKYLKPNVFKCIKCM